MNAEKIVQLLRDRRETITCAESITGGALTSALVSIPGASHVLRGSIVAYSSEIKIQELNVDSALIEEKGVVSEEVALAMATGVKNKFSANWAVALTGVAGPGASHGIPAGTVWLALLGPGVQETVKLEMTGEREMVRRGAVESALGVLERILSA
jgi:nicotinamide-nucleotide amidase